MTIKHHLSDTTLGAFSAGSLSEGLSFVAASHVSFCPICQERQKKLEELGGVFLQSTEPSNISELALQNVLTKLDEHEQEQNSDPDPSDASLHSSTDGLSSQRHGPMIPGRQQNYVPDNLNDIKWKSLAPGIKYFAISNLQTNGGTLSMLNIEPGVKIPEHGHQGIELTQVLKGSFSDDVGSFGVGDIADLDDDIKHQPIVGSNEPCICLIASEAPLKFTGLMPRLVHYFSGM
jgi:putative transcriptional regulator